jgi:hypothetical protein
MFFHDIFLHLFLFPRRVDSAIAGREEAKNLAGKVIRLIQDPFDDAESGENRASLSRQFAAAVNRQFEFEKRGQLFIGPGRLRDRSICLQGLGCGDGRILGMGAPLGVGLGRGVEVGVGVGVAVAVGVGVGVPTSPQNPDTFIV